MKFWMQLRPFRLQKILRSNGVDTSGCTFSHNLPSGSLSPNCGMPSHLAHLAPVLGRSLASEARNGHVGCGGWSEFSGGGRSQHRNSDKRLTFLNFQGRCWLFQFPRKIG